MLRCLMLALLGLAAFSLHAQETYFLEFGQPIGEEQELRLSIGKSQIIRSRVALDQVVIGNPEVADIKLLSANQVLILGIKPGHTNLVFKDKNRSLVALMDVVVGYDIIGIKRKIFEVAPNESSIEIRGSNDAVIMSGQITDVQNLEKVMAVARSYVPEDKVMNLMQVGGGHQVMLEVKVAEVSRSSLKELGFETAFGNVGSNSSGAFMTGGNNLFLTPPPVSAPVPTPSFGVVDYIETGANLADLVSVRLQALEKKGLARTLAEPNIVAMSGQEANFLVGGEVPIPIDQDDNTITIQFKEFGVALEFTPTVLSSHQINLKLRTEVSEIDESRSFSLGGGLAIPSFSTRRMGSTIEMADGQSFAVAGLLQNNLTEAIEQFPWLGDIPVLGALFRSNSFLREESELVVVVTPRLVKPVNHGLSLPTDVIIPPSEADFYLLGRLEGRNLVDKKSRGHKSHASGIEGAYGHE